MIAIGLALLGCGSPPAPPPTEPSELTKALEQMTDDQADAPQPTTIDAAAEAQRQAALPKPPEGSSWEELYAVAGRHYEMGSWRPALLNYQMVLQLKPDCELCVTRLARLAEQINTDRDEAFSRGLSYYDSQQFSLAMTAFQTVLELEPAPESTHHQRAAEYLELADSKLPKGPSLQVAP